MKYKDTVIITGYNFKGIKPGQWVKISGQDIRGQYLGTTARGTEIVRWQNDNFAKRDAKANKPLREFARIYGAS
jgi:hypothetical protein